MFELQLVADSSCHMYPQDRLQMQQWLIKRRHSQRILDSDSQSLTRLAISLGLDLQKLHGDHRDIMKKKLLSSLDYTLKAFKAAGKITET